MTPRPIYAWTLLLSVLAVMALLSPPPLASGAVPDPVGIDVKIIRLAGNYVITVSGTAPASGAWLGRSIYAYGIRNKASDGHHDAIRVASAFVHTWTVPIAAVNGGSYEVALWASRVPSAQCRISNDPWCKRNGFHLAGMITYRGGWLPR